MDWSGSSAARDAVAPLGDGNPYVGRGHRWWFVLEGDYSEAEREDALSWLTERLVRDVAWVVFPTGGLRL